MAARFNDQTKDEPRSTASLTLVDLLDKKQPYKEFRVLDDPDLNILDNDNTTLLRIQGSLVGLAIGDALGASVEFRPNAYMKEHPVEDMQSGGTWGLQAGQWTDDTSMALCLAASLIVKKGFDPYDQFVRYKKWYRDGYMSSTGKCFDIGKSTRDAITRFETRLQETRNQMIGEKYNSNDPSFNAMVEHRVCSNSGLKLGTSDSAGNGPLMRLAPIPCFFFGSYEDVEKHIDEATQLTHGDPRAIDACRFYACLIWYALRGEPKDKLLDSKFYEKCSKRPLHRDVQKVAEGSYKSKDGYKGGVRGKGYVVDSLEAALWAFYNDEGKFDVGVLKAVNLGDDTDTTAAIYGELAGAVYGIKEIPSRWIKQLYEGQFIIAVAKGLYVTGNQLKNSRSDRENTESRTEHQPDTNDINRNNGKKSGNNTAQDAGTNNEARFSQGTNRNNMLSQNVEINNTQPKLITEH